MSWLSDRNLAWLGLGVALGALYYGMMASKQNKEIISHTKEIKKNLKV